jgi:AraC-like DNA-binding protein
MQTIPFIVLEFAAVAHLMMSIVAFLYARHKIAYLPLAWIMLIFCLFFVGGLVCVACGLQPRAGAFHPVLLIYLLACTFLQSVCPLGIAMPGYLQMRRMWSYANPVIGLIAFYFVYMPLTGQYDFLNYAISGWRQLLSFDGFMSLMTLGLSVYYFINLFRLPHLRVREIHIPVFLKAYGVATGLVSAFLVVVAVHFSMLLFIIYVILFTLTNLYLFCRTLETTALSLPQPDISAVESKPQLTKDEQDDFNKANRRRFEMVEFYMQNQQPWRDNLFGRDRLCEQVGINRHLLLQCLRSQGYNNIHEYINRYRVEGIRRGLSSGSIRSLSDCLGMGFGSLQTARNSFQRMGLGSLDDYVAEALSAAEKGDEV